MCHDHGGSDANVLLGRPTPSKPCGLPQKTVRLCPPVGQDLYTGGNVSEKAKNGAFRTRPGQHHRNHGAKLTRAGRLRVRIVSETSKTLCAFLLVFSKKRRFATGYCCENGNTAAEATFQRWKGQAHGRKEAEVYGTEPIAGDVADQMTKREQPGRFPRESRQRCGWLWYPRSDSNRHARRRGILNPLRLPFRHLGQREDGDTSRPGRTQSPSTHRLTRPPTCGTDAATHRTGPCP